MIYRIIQEILANAVRHASASSIMLQCSQNGDVFLITAEDDGRGFEFDAQGAAPGMGMSNIKNRVEYLNGKLELNSIINEGTVINIELDVCSTS
jgi:signal transduction histidine kinase